MGNTNRYQYMSDNLIIVYKIIPDIHIETYFKTGMVNTSSTLGAFERYNKTLSIDKFLNNEYYIDLINSINKVFDVVSDGCRNCVWQEPTEMEIRCQYDLFAENLDINYYITLKYDRGDPIKVNEYKDSWNLLPFLTKIAINHYLLEREINRGHMCDIS